MNDNSFPANSQNNGSNPVSGQQFTQSGGQNTGQGTSDDKQVQMPPMPPNFSAAPVPPVAPPMPAAPVPPVSAPVAPPMPAAPVPPVSAPVAPPMPAAAVPPVSAPVAPPMPAAAVPPVSAPVAPPMPAAAVPPVSAPVAPPMPAAAVPPVSAPVAPPMPAAAVPPVSAPVAPPMPGIQAPTAGFPAGGVNPPIAGQTGTQVTDDKKEDKTPANFQLGTYFKTGYNIPFPKHNLNVDEKKFIELLAGSISLSKAEKQRILDSIPKLKQSQVDELINIFTDERRKFAELPKKHTKELEKLALKHYKDWVSIEDDYKAKNMKNEDAGKADEIRKQLGL